MNIIDYNLEFKILRTRLDTNKIVLHHSASHDVSVREIHCWHQEKGCSGIGYHFVIRSSGLIEAGRPLDTIGAHAGNEANSDSIGICLTGNFENNPPAPEQMEALLTLIKYLEEHYNKSLEVLRHRDISATICPGSQFPWPLPKVIINDAWKQKLVNRALEEEIITEAHDPDDKADIWFVLAVGLNILDRIPKL